MKSRMTAALAVLLVLILVGCGNGADGGGSEDGSGNGTTDTSDIDVCALLSDEEVTAAIGSAPPKEPTEPAGPFTGCKWGSRLFVQIAPAVTLITAPAEVDCPSAGIGDESTMCLGSVKFLTNGIHTTVSTIEDVTLDQMKAVATTLLPKLQG